jgi:nucleotide-binding universal stress UspA family protein
METILCPVDFSPCAVNAAHYAQELAIRMNARFVLLHVLPFPTPEPLLEFPTRQGQLQDNTSTKSLLDDLFQVLLKQHPEVAIIRQSQIRYGHVTEEVTQVARKEEVNLIVLGTKGAHGLRRRLLGSNAAKVVAMATCPVLVVPQPALFKSLSKIVIAVDFGATLPPDFSLVIRIAKTFDAEVDFVHVLKDASEMKQNMAQIGLRHQYQSLNYDKISFFTTESKNVEKGVLDFACEMQAEMLVMVHYRESFWQYLTSSSQTEQLVYHSALPILVIRA